MTAIQSAGSDQRVRDFAQEDLGGLGPDALEALQPLADVGSRTCSAHQARDGAVFLELASSTARGPVGGIPKRFGGPGIPCFRNPGPPGLIQMTMSKGSWRNARLTPLPRSSAKNSPR